MQTVGALVAPGVRSEFTFKFHAGTCLRRIGLNGFWGIRKMTVLKTVFVRPLCGSEQALL